jgi:hypothetical protein
MSWTGGHCWAVPNNRAKIITQKEYKLHNTCNKEQTFRTEIEISDILQTDIK